MLSRVFAVRLLLLLMVALPGSTTLMAQTATWTGLTSTSWNTATNWNPAAIPTATDDVVIPSAPATQPVLSTTATAKSVEVQSGASLTITSAGSLTINNSRRFQTFIASFWNRGRVVSGGQLIINNTTGSVGYGLVNTGNFDNVAGGQISIDGANTLGLYNVNGGFVNLSTITIRNASQYSVFSRDANFSNSGCSALLRVNDAIITAQGGGVLTNTGTIIENATGNSNISSNTGLVQNLNGGTFNIGTNTGILTTTPGTLWTGCTNTNWNTASNWSGATVPLPTDDVVIPSGPTNQPILSTTATARTVEVQSGASLSITSAGSLSVDGSKEVNAISSTFLNNGTVQNSGQLIIRSTAGVGNYGLFNLATFRNNVGGAIRIDHINTAGIYNLYGNFTNAATITIGAVASVGTFGLVNIIATFENNTGGVIQIDRAISPLFNVTDGSFTNAATITIGASATVGTTGVVNQATFSNAGCGALLTVVANAVIDNTDSFSNTGTIIENATGNSSISYNGGLVQNLNGGTFTIGTNTGVLTTSPGNLWTGCTSRDWNTAANWASGNVPTASSDAVISSAPANQPVIGAGTLAVAKSVEVQSGASLSIAGGGSLTLNGSKGVGGSTTAFYNTGTVSNSGQLIMGNTAAIGTIGLNNLSTFSNNAGGTISIDRSGAIGLRNNAGSFTNSGMVSIGAVATVGQYGLYNLSTFSNNAGGTISIDRTADYGLFNDGSTNTFTNSATITIGAVSTVGTNGIVNLATFTNQGCSGLIRIVSNSIVRNSGTFANGGTIIENASGNSSVSTNTGLVQNLNGGTFTIGTNTGVLTTSPGTLWTGCTSTDWNTASNWSGGTVPLATDDVVIPSGPTNQPVIGAGTLAVAKSMHVQSGASLSIVSAGSLTINGFATLGGFATAFYNQGTVTNGGTVMLGNTAPVGLIGLHNTGTFTNSGTLQVDRATNQGINNRVTATFTNTGNIIMGASVSMGTQGIWNQATFVHSGGTITIDRITGDGLLNSGNFVNSATITIGASATVTGNGLTNEASFANAMGGLLQIDQTGGRGIANKATFINGGTVNVGSLSTVTGNGVWVSSSGSFSNNAGGNISINRTGSGLGSNGVNNGGTFVNSSTLTIGDVAFAAQDNVYNAGTFTNTATGEIRADRATGNGIWNTSGTFNNAGLVVLGANAVTGASGILSLAPFANTGEIRVDRCANGVVSTNTFANTGHITIGASASLSASGVISTGTSASFVNSGVGTMRIDRTGGSGLSNANGSTFTNSATIVIGASAPVGGNGLNNEGTFANLPCAVLSLPASVSNNGTMTNAGFFTVSTTQLHTNTGTLTNNGVISYPQGNPIPNVTNNALVVAPFSLCGTASTTALQIGGSNSFLAGTTWYTDAALTTAGGTYNAGTNIFTPSSLSLGAHTLYFTTTDNANACTNTVSASVTANALPTASLIASGTLTCAQTSVTLTASGGTSYTFANAGGTLGTPGSASTLVVSAGGTYSVTVGNDNGCTATSTTAISQNIVTPAASLTTSTGSLSFCNGTLLTLVAGTGATYRFSTGATQTGGSVGNTATVNATGTYSVTVTGANGCTNTASVSVSIVAVTTITNTLPATVSVCEGTAPPGLSITATGANLTYQWFKGTTPLPDQTSTVLTFGAASPTDAGNYYVVVSGACGTASSNTLVLTVRPRPAAPGLAPVSRTAVAAPAATIPLPQFVVATGTLSFSGVNGLLSPPNAAISAAGVFSFSVTQTDGFGCTSLSMPFSLTVLSPLPPSSQTLCRGNQVVLTVLSSGVRYEWYKNGQTAANKLINVVGVQQGTTAASLTLVSVQTSATYYGKTVQADGSFSWSGPFAVVIGNCGGRVAVSESAESLQITVAPNPLVESWLRATVSGAGGQPLRLELVDQRGQLLIQQAYASAASQAVAWDLSQQPAGVFVLRAVSAGKATTVSVLKP